jgi:hypothetical protein
MAWDSAAWKAFKVAYDDAEKASATGELDELLLRIGPLRRNLAAVFAGELSAQLSALVSARAAARRVALRPVRGKPIRTDPVVALRKAMARLEGEQAALSTLRTLRAPDPWIEDRLAADAAASAADVADLADDVGCEHPGEEGLLREARDLVARLGPPSPPRAR